MLDKLYEDITSQIQKRKDDFFTKSKVIEKLVENDIMDLSDTDISGLQSILLDITLLQNQLEVLTKLNIESIMSED